MSLYRPSYPQRAGHRCGTTVTRRWTRKSKSKLSLSRTGIWQYNRHLTTKWTSASTGERAKLTIQTRCGLALRLAYPLHRKSLCRTAHFGGEPAPQGFAASQDEGFPTDRWLTQGATLRFMRLKCLSVARSVSAIEGEVLTGEDVPKVGHGRMRAMLRRIDVRGKELAVAKK